MDHNSLDSVNKALMGNAAAYITLHMEDKVKLSTMN